jgi:hypothetical protein
MDSPQHYDVSTPKRSRVFTGFHTSSFTWVVTFLLLACVSAIYAFSGTDGGAGGLYGRMAVAGFSVIALVVFFTRRKP